MHIQIDVCGFYEWAPVPPGTVVTTEDIKKLRVKQMADDAWHMRVDMKRDTHHDMVIHELSICQTLAVHAVLGMDTSREDAVMLEAKQSLKHHLARRHMHALTVYDTGPNEDLFRMCLATEGVVDERQQEAVDRYMEGLKGDELAAYLNTLLRTKPRKTP